MTIPTFPTSTELPGLTYPAVRTPLWATDREETMSGRRTRYAHRNVPLWHWELQFSFLRSSTQFAEWQNIVSFFNSLYGAQGIFQFRDDQDYQATDQSLGFGDGVNTNYQLVRTGPTAAGEFTENVYAISSVSKVVKGGTTQTSTQFAILDGGIVHFDFAPSTADQLVWTGQYNWLCRFDDDTLDLSRFMQYLYELKTLKFTSEIL